MLMRIIQAVVDKIDDELEDAEKYIKCARKTKENDPQLAETYYTLSLEEMKHMNMLHDQVVRIINDYKKDHEVPAGMLEVYEYVHNKQIKWAAKIKAKQEAYKKP